MLTTALRAPQVGTRFAVDPTAVEVRSERGPVGFYASLRELIRGAQTQLTIASLYLGTDEKERALLDDVREALRRSDALRVRVVLDYSRAQRATPSGSSVDLLAPLVRDFGQRVEVYLHAMPQLSTPWGALLPSPYDEVLTVFHLKALVADGVTIFTGSNLSDEYFRCRRARHYLVRDRAVCETLHSLVATIGDHSLQVECAGPGGARLAHPRRRAGGLARALRSTSKPWPRPTDGSTRLSLLIQHPSLGVQQERAVVRSLLAVRQGDLTIATPYPNFPADYLTALRRRASRPAGRTLLVTPSPRSHTFTTGRGLKRHLPAVYAHGERQIARRLKWGQPGSSLAWRHYDREGWVFHAKGVWLTGPEEAATVIGSSSFGWRSVTSDLDASVLIETRDPRLRRAIREEAEALEVESRPAEPSPPPPLGIRLVYPLVRRFL